MQVHTRIKTRLSLRSTSVMASLLERDIMDDVLSHKVGGGWSAWKVRAARRGTEYLLNEQVGCLEILNTFHGERQSPDRSDRFSGGVEEHCFVSFGGATGERFADASDCCGTDVNDDGRVRGPQGTPDA